MYPFYFIYSYQILSTCPCGPRFLKKIRTGQIRPAERVAATRPDPTRAQIRQTCDPLEPADLVRARAKKFEKKPY
jgi:hypothetical protein